MEVILSTNRTGDDHYFDSQVDSSEGGMGPYWAIHWGSGIIKRLRTPGLDEDSRYAPAYLRHFQGVVKGF